MAHILVNVATLYKNYKNKKQKGLDPCLLCVHCPHEQTHCCYSRLLLQTRSADSYTLLVTSMWISPRPHFYKIMDYPFNTQRRKVIEKAFMVNEGIRNTMIFPTVQGDTQTLVAVERLTAPRHPSKWQWQQLGALSPFIEQRAKNIFQRCPEKAKLFKKCSALGHCGLSAEEYCLQI